MKMKVTDLVALHPTCRYYNRVRVPLVKFTKAIERHNSLLRNITRKLSSVHGTLCFEEKTISARLSKWGEIIGRVDAICLKVRDGTLEQLIVVEVKGYRSCGLCEKLQIALYIMTLVLNLNTTKIAGLLVCNDKVESITLNDILESELYEELSKVIRVLVND